MPADELDALFEVPPGEFVRARDALARRLRDEGRGDEAREVGARRRPPPAVWALNQVARRQPDEVAALLAAGDEVRSAQRRGDGRRLRQAGDEVQAHASRLAAAAARLVVAEGVAALGRQPEIEAALRAAALSGADAPELERGRLARLPEAPTGLDMWAAGVDAEPEPDEAEPEAEAPKPEPDPQEQVEQARARHEEAAAAVERAREELDEAEARVEEVEAQLDRARVAVAEARAHLRDAERAARQAEREVERLARRSGR